MKCMCAQTRPRFILSSEGVLGGMEFEPMLTPREKSPLPEKVPRGGSNPRRCGQRAQALPTELFRPPHSHNVIGLLFCSIWWATSPTSQYSDTSCGSSCNERHDDGINRHVNYTHNLNGTGLSFCSIWCDTAIPAVGLPVMIIMMMVITGMLTTHSHNGIGLLFCSI